MVQGKRFKPDAVVSFFTETGELVARAKGKEGSIIGGDIIQINTQNDLEGDAGIFSVTLTARNRWDKVVASNDLVTISLTRGGSQNSKESSVMVGLVDDVRKSTSVQDNSIQRQVIISGRTFAKALINFEIGVVQEVEMSTESLGWLGDRVTFNGVSSAEILQQVMEKLVYKYMDYNFSFGAKLTELISLELSSREGELSANDKAFSNYQGSMQSFFREIIDEPFNQMFWEVYNGVPTFVERETPFNEDKWKNLPIHTITDEDVVMDDTGRNDIETYVLYSVGLQSFFSAADLNSTTGIKPIWYKPYSKKYGIRRLNRFTSYVIFGTSDMTDKLKKYQEDLYNWNILNPDFYNGELTIKGQNYYKIGDRLLYDSKEDERIIEYFIEGVSHEFVNMSHWITRLSVTRGLPDSGASRFKTPWGSSEEYTGGAIGTTVGSPATTGGVDGDINFPSGGTPNENRNNIVNIAKSFTKIHTTYRLGAGRNSTDIANNIFDCSSFVRHVYAMAGYDIGPLTGTTTKTLVKEGTAVESISNLEPADLVFWNTAGRNGHVGIYIGDGQAIACNTDHGVSQFNMNSSYWKPMLSSTMRRIIN